MKKASSMSPEKKNSCSMNTHMTWTFAFGWLARCWRQLMLSFHQKDTISSCLSQISHKGLKLSRYVREMRMNLFRLGKRNVLRTFPERRYCCYATKSRRMRMHTICCLSRISLLWIVVHFTNTFVIVYVIDWPLQIELIFANVVLEYIFFFYD